MVEGKQTGIVGMDEIFQELYQAGKRPDESLKEELLNRLKDKNYIPPAKEETYASAFLQEYKRFIDDKEGGLKEGVRDLGTWQGIPREEVPWYPTIREESCDGCNVCVEFCTFRVFEYDEKTNKVKVANPFNCQIGCSMCALKCKPNAILFPPLTILEAFRKR
jgi:NAD-dependent dihydropyrimidine dehydrogenase PreA subunit